MARQVARGPGGRFGRVGGDGVIVRFELDASEYQATLAALEGQTSEWIARTTTSYNRMDQAFFRLAKGGVTDVRRSFVASETASHRLSSAFRTLSVASIALDSPLLMLSNRMALLVDSFSSLALAAGGGKGRGVLAAIRAAATGSAGLAVGAVAGFGAIGTVLGAPIAQRRNPEAFARSIDAMRSYIPGGGRTIQDAEADERRLADKLRATRIANALAERETSKIMAELRAKSEKRRAILDAQYAAGATGGISMADELTSNPNSALGHHLAATERIRELEREERERRQAVFEREEARQAALAAEQRRVFAPVSDIRSRAGMALQEQLIQQRERKILEEQLPFISKYIGLGIGDAADAFGLKAKITTGALGVSRSQLQSIQRAGGIGQVSDDALKQSKIQTMTLKQIDTTLKSIKDLVTTGGGLAP